MRACWLLAIAFSLTHCGYNLRGNTRPFFEQHQIHTIYVQPVKNNSYKAGVEITVYNALRKRFGQGGYVRIVDTPSEADAIISAYVQDASYAPAAPISADQFPKSDPNARVRSDMQIASAYSVNLKVGFNLTQTHPEKQLWADELARTKTFQANTYYGNLGTTSALINDSDFERTVGDLSVSIVTDAEESINTIF